MSMSRFSRLFILPLLTLGTFANGGEIWTTDGRQLEGVVKIDAKGDVGLLSPTASLTKFKLDEIVYVWPGTIKGGQVNFAAAVGYKTFPLKTSGGSITLNDGAYTLKGSGEDVFGTSDSCTFYAREIGGDADLSAKIVEVGPGHALAGLMVRDSADPSASHAMIAVTADGDLVFRYRQQYGGQTVELPLGKVKLPVVLRLTRQGRQCTAFQSRDDKGHIWKLLGRAFTDKHVAEWNGRGRKGPEPGIDLGSLYYAGMVLASGANTEAKSVMDDVRVHEGIVEPYRVPSPDEQNDPLVICRPEDTAKGIVLRSGSFLAGATITALDKNQVKIAEANGTQTTLDISKLSRFNMASLPAGLSSNIPADSTGVLLENGEFMEGQIDNWKDGKITVSSIVFGLASFKVPEQAKILAWHGPTDSGARWIFYIRDGSILLAKSFRADQMDILIEEPVMGLRRVALKDIQSFRFLSDRIIPLAQLRPQKITLRFPGTEVFAGSCFDATWGNWLTASNRGAAMGVAIPAGAEVTYNLPAGTRRLVCWAGIPERVGTSESDYRFILTADGARIMAAAPVKTKDGRTLVPLDVLLGGKKTLTIRVEVTGKTIEGVGLLGDAFLLK